MPPHPRALKTLLLWLGLSAFLPAQNLLPNGGFETHAPLDCITCPMTEQKFAAVVPHWKTANGGYPFLCDCRLQAQAAAANVGICDFTKVKPHSGCNMMEMEYVPSCLDQNHENRGVPSYLATRLPAPLELEHVYEVSFWLYILPPFPGDEDFTRFIGFNLYPHVIRNPAGKMLEGGAFRLDTVMIGQWYQVKWLVRPVCHLQYILFGLFYDDERPPVNLNGYHNRYYLDDISIQKIPNTTREDAIVPYCKFTAAEKDDSPPEIAGSACYFTPGDSALSESARSSLDSFAQRARVNTNAIFMVSGRTDNIGTDHQALAQARINSTLDYLENVHKLPRFRFFAWPIGVDIPLAENHTEAGRALNRSVLIQQMDGPVYLMVYRYLLEAVFKGQTGEAFRLMNIWLHLAPDKQKMMALMDPRLAPLHSDARWNAQALKKVRACYQKLPQPALAFMLDSLGMEDQKCRTLDRYLENLHTYMAALDSADRRWDVHFSCADEWVTEREDSLRMQFLTGKIGLNWPKISDVGERPAKAAFWLISHTTDTALIAQYLPLIKRRCEEGEAAWIHYATLYDRLAVFRGRPQRYGTQYRPTTKQGAQPDLFPLENPAMVEEWRKELGID